MSDLDKFNYECEGQISLFDGSMLREVCDTKPEIGTKLIFHHNNKNYDCVVKSHCEADYFYVEFTDRKPSEDDSMLSQSDGFHISLMGYKKDWDFPEVMP